MFNKLRWLLPEWFTDRRSRQELLAWGNEKQVAYNRLRAEFYALEGRCAKETDDLKRRIDLERQYNTESWLYQREALDKAEKAERQVKVWEAAAQLAGFNRPLEVKATVKIK